MRLSALRWLILGLLFLSTVINYVDRQALSVLRPTLRKELGLTSADYGTITTVFMLAHALAQVPAGMWIDRVGTRIGFSVSISIGDRRMEEDARSEMHTGRNSSPTGT
jgi:ACS family hexuronate transporter-like MFS transporter